MEIEPQKEYTLTECVLVTGVKHQRMRGYLKSGRLPAYKPTEKGHYRILGKDLLEFLNWREKQIQPLVEAAAEVDSWENLEQMVKKETTK